MAVKSIAQSCAKFGVCVCGQSKIYMWILYLKLCLQVTFFKNGLLLLSIVSMNNGQNGSVTHSVVYLACRHWHNAKQ